jgi:hypothetical protein
MKNIVSALPRVVRTGWFMCLLALISMNCVDMPLAPVAPMSDIKLEGISIIDITRTFADFLAKDTTLTRNANGTSSYIKSESLTPQGIPPLKLQPQPSSQKVDVGQFKVNGFSKNSTFPATSISPSFSGTLPLLPAGSFPVSAVSVNDTSYDYIRIDTGKLYLTITNNMPVPIDFPNPIVLHNNWSNPGDNSVVASFSFTSPINPAGTITVPAVLDGKLLRGSLMTDPIQVHTSGSLSPVTFTSTSGLSISFQSTNLSADSALAMIPPQSVASINDSVLVVDSLTVIQNASFTKGLILLRLVNNLGIDVGVDLTVNEMKQGGTSYSINQTLTARQTQDINLDFSKISIQADPPMKQYGTTVKFSVGITTLDSKGTKKVVTKNDFVQALFIPKDSLVIRSVTGKIQPTTVPVNSGVASGINGLDLGNLTAKVALKGLQLKMNLPITGGFPTDYHLAFIAKNSRMNVIDSILLVSGSGSSFPRINPSTGATVIQLSNPEVDIDGFISKFFPEVPDSFFVRGSLTIDPPDIFSQTAVYSIYDTTKVYPSFDMNFPVALGIKSGVIKEVVAFGKQEIPKDFTKAVGQGTLTFYFYNKFPIKMYFHANFLGNYNPQTHQGDTLLFIAPSDTIQAASVDVNGLTTAPTFSKASISLNGAQMVQFNKADSLYIRFDMSTSNNGQVVRMRDTDYIRVYAKGDITYTVNKP